MHKRAIVAGLSLAALGAGCASPGPMTLGGITIMRHGIMNGGPAALYSGPVVFREGCVEAVFSDGTFEPIIWPPTAQLVSQGDELLLVVDGLIIHHTDPVEIGGGEYTDLEFVAELSGPVPEACRADRYWLATGVTKP